MIFVKKFQIFLKFILRKSEPRSNVVRCSRLFLDHDNKTLIRPKNAIF